MINFRRPAGPDEISLTRTTNITAPTTSVGSIDYDAYGVYNLWLTVAAIPVP